MANLIDTETFEFIEASNVWLRLGFILAQKQLAF